METVTKDWLKNDAPAVRSDLDEIRRRLDGAEPTDGSVAGDEYTQCREFINTIERAGELLFTAHVEVVDEEEVQNPRPFETYERFRMKLRDVAHREVPTRHHDWRTEFDDAKAELQDLFRDCPDP